MDGGDKGRDTRRLRGQEEKGTDVGAEASGGISKVDLTFKLETKAQNTATLLPPQGSTLMHTRMSRSTLVTCFLKIQHSKTPSHTGILKDEQGNSLTVQWLGLHTSTAGNPGLIPGQGTKIPAKRAICGQKKRCESPAKIFTTLQMELLQGSF